MFVAWRDLRFAKGRFALMGTVVVLITLLVGLLSGLTAGLARENTSAITGLPADHLAFAAPPDGQSVSFANSVVEERSWRAWGRQKGVEEASAVGIRTLSATGDGHAAAVSAFGVEPGGGIAPAGVGPGRVVLAGQAAEELGASAGDRIRLGGFEAEVARVAGDASYSHTPVVWTSLDDWQKIGRSGANSGSSVGSGGGGESGRNGSSDHSDSSGPSDPSTSATAQATVVALRTTGDADLAAGDRAAGTRTLALGDALSAIGSYRAENGSLQLMRGFLFVISALVIGAFFVVWTIQRAGDVAVLKALGASTPYLLRDALGQAVVLLVAGTVLGTAAAVGIGALISGGDVPFVLDAPTVLGPAAVMIALGTLGAGLCVRRITAVDPLTALGSAR